MARRDEEFAEFFSAEEITQAAFVRVYARWSRVDSSTADAYLRTVLTRGFLDTRRRGRAREQAVAEPPDRAVPADAGTEDRLALRAALLGVPPGQRTVLVLRFLADLSVEQVAETLGCSTGTVKSQTARGLAALRIAYDRQDESTIVYDRQIGSLVYDQQIDGQIVYDQPEDCIQSAGLGAAQATSARRP